MDIKKLNEYARLCIELGVNLQAGQLLVINSPIEALPFVQELAKEAYHKGAKEVICNWSDNTLTKLAYENEPLTNFEIVPKWIIEKYDYFMENKPAVISVSASDPELLKNAPPEKLAAANKSRSTALKKFSASLMNNEFSWLVVSIPTEAWAKKVFPDASDPVAKLWEAIFAATRMDTADPVLAWKEHIDNLKKKMDFLNEMDFKYLHYTTDEGTDLRVELPDGHIWIGGGENNKDGNYFVANIPTEEVFTAPHREGVDGILLSTKPLVYSGRVIDGIRLKFEKGRVVDYDASVGKEVLTELLETDEGAKHLGEIALVPYNSPISNSKILFYNTLFDENASCHFAFGKAYPINFKSGENMTVEELLANGINDSLVHSDFMVGSKSLSIFGERKNGEKVAVFMNGNWAI